MLSNAKIQLYAITFFALLFVSGLILASHLPIAFSPVQWAAATLACVLPLVLSPGGGFLCRAFSFIVPVILGCFVMSLDIEEMSRTPKPEYTRYEALVLSKPVRKGKTIQFEALVTAATGCHSRPFKVKISVYQPAPDSIGINAGECVECCSVLTGIQSHASNAPGYVRYLYTRGFRAQTLVYPDNIHKKKGTSERLPLTARLQQLLLRIRMGIMHSYSDNGISGDNLAVVSALTLGEKSDVSSGVKDTYSKSGASHVLALSGLHIGIIYTLLTLVFGVRNGRTWRKLLANTIVLLTVWGYVFLVGMPVSAVRSALLLTIYNVLSFSQRSYEPINALSFAALLILLFSPMSVYDIGFQLSFIAVASILFMYDPIYKALCTSRLAGIAPYRWVAGITAVSVAAQIGTAPVVAHYFGRFACYFLLSNFIAVPVAMALLYCSVAMLVAAPLPPLQSWVASVMGRFAQFMNSSLETISELPGSSIEGLNVSVAQILAYYVAISCIVAAGKIVCRQRIKSYKDYDYPDD